MSKTPGGVFTFYRRYGGKRLGPLGGMTNPAFFNYRNPNSTLVTTAP